MTTQTTSSTPHGASGLPITQLGSTIKAHWRLIEKYEEKSHENRMAAGLHLIEAKGRIADGEYEGHFAKFLNLECGGLCTSRAYELIAIASGKTTHEDHRSAARARDQAYRDRKAHQKATEDFMATVRAERAKMEAEAEARRAAAATVRRPTERPKAAKAAADDLIARAKSDCPEAALIAQIVGACQGQTVERLQAALAVLTGGTSDQRQGDLNRRRRQAEAEAAAIRK